MKKIFFIVFTLLIGIILFILAVEKVGFTLLMQTIFTLPLWGIFVILAVCFLVVLIDALRWSEILKSVNLHYSFKQIFKSVMGNFAVSYLTPVARLGGEPVRAYMIAGAQKIKKEEIPWPRIIFSIILDKIFEIGFNLILVFLAIALLLFKFSLPGYLRSIALGFILVVFLICVLLLNKKGLGYILKKTELNKLKGFEATGDILKEIGQEMKNFFKIDNPYLYSSIFFSILKEAAALMKTWIILFFLNIYVVSISSLFVTTVLVTGLLYLASVVPVPAAVGALELGQVFAFEVLGYGANIGGAFSIVLRFGELFLTFVGMIFFLHYGFKRFVERAVEAFRNLGKKLSIK